MSVLSQDEADFYNEQSKQYMTQFGFTNIADLSDLTRLLFFELQVFRLSGWMAKGKDPNGYDLEEGPTRRAIREYSDQLSKIKNDLGMTKAQRDKEREQSTAAYLKLLHTRAKEFGVHREHQLRMALRLMNDLSAVLGAFDRSDAVERDKLGFPDEASILAWVRESMLPDFAEVDIYFRSHAQKFWLQDI